MIRNKLCRAMIPFLLLVGMTACKSIDGRTEKNIQQRNMCAEVLNAIGENDYDAFRNVCGDLIPEKQFIAAHQNLQKQFGKMKDFKFVTSLRTPLVQNDIWLVTFQRKNAEKNEEITQDILFRFVTGEDADGWKVIGFAFL